MTTTDAVAGYENRFAGIDRRLAQIEGDLKPLTWMTGFNLAATVGVVFMLLRH